MKEFIKKYKLQIAVGVVIASSVIYVIYNNSRKGNILNKQKKLKNLADSDKRKWEGKKETDKQMSDTLIKYWKGVGLTVTPAQMQSSSYQKNYPWSASYVTHLIKNAGYNFKGGSFHSEYAVKGKSDRSSKTKNSFWAFRPSEKKKIEVGDILIKNRSGSKNNYDTIKSGDKSHGDVVVDIKTEGNNKIAYYQGGNLSNSVGRGTIKLDDSGLLPSNSPYFLQLKYIK
jgi:hypothetical protein